MKDITNEQGKILDEILDERERQDKQWGGSEHDNEHSGHDWETMITKHAGKLTNSLGIKEPDYRQRLVKIAALAVAAIEAEDRR